MTQLNGELLTPIPGANPAGSYLRYDPLYEQIKEARREDDGMSQGDWETTRKTADWGLVVRLATDALAKKTKDLQIAAWLTEAWLRRDGFSGLSNGLQLLRELLESYWDTIYPEVDEDGDDGMRAAPLGLDGQKFDVAVNLVALNAEGHTLAQHVAARDVPTEEQAASESKQAEKRARFIADGRLPPEEIEKGYQATSKDWYRSLLAEIDSALEALENLNSFCRERFTDPPETSNLADALKGARQIVTKNLARKLEDDPDPAPVPGAAEAQAAGSDPVATGGTAGAAAPSAGAGVNIAAGPRNAEDAALWVAAAARTLRREQPTSPAPYLLLRSLRWGELRAGGGRIDPRLLAAPSTEVRTKLKGLLLDAAWPELLQAAEEVMGGTAGRGWLDLQRYALTAVSGMGEEYQTVGTAIRGALRTLLHDLPELLSQTLMDDSPTANAETRGWLAEEKMLPDGTAVEEPQPVATATSKLGRDAWEIAQARVRAGDAQSAMELLMREATQEKSARARFLRRAQAADVMVGAGMESVAMPILRDLLALIETHRLEEWEAGDVVARPLALAYRCARRLDNSDVNPDSLYERICRLDPIRAIQLQTATSTSHGDE